MIRGVFILAHSLATAFFLVALAGCNKTDSQSAQSVQPSTFNLQPSTPSTPALRLHWLGKKRLAAESNATNFMAIWNLPESAKLEAQTLDKLSTAPWRLWQTNTTASNAPAALCRPLLDDLVQEESYLEVLATTNQPATLVLAIRLDAARAALWQTNLPIILQSIFGSSTEPRAQTPDTDFSFQTSALNFNLSRSGDWTLFSLSQASRTPARPQPSNLLSDFAARIQRDHVPFAARTANYWLEVQGDLQRLSDAFALDWGLPPNLPYLTITMVGVGETVQTRGELTFTKPPAVPLEPWNIPTNLIGKSLTSFTAIRGLAPWLETSKLYGDLQVGPAPNQLFCWSLAELPMQSLLAVPLGNPDNRFSRVQQRLIAAGNSWLATNSVGNFVERAGSSEVVWQGAPFMSPFVRVVGSAPGSFMALGLLQSPLTNLTGNVELAGRVFARTNAVYYDWEFTGPRIESWFYMGQLFRVIFGRGQLPADSTVTAWLKALQPKLSNSGTVITVAEPARLSFERFSTLGFTALELHLFADWIESPQFPRGLHTTQVATKRKLSRMPAGPQAAPMKP